MSGDFFFLPRRNNIYITPLLVCVCILSFFFCSQTLNNANILHVYSILGKVNFLLGMLATKRNKRLYIQTHFLFRKKRGEERIQKKSLLVFTQYILGNGNYYIKTSWHESRNNILFHLRLTNTWLGEFFKNNKKNKTSTNFNCEFFFSLVFFPFSHFIPIIFSTLVFFFLLVKMGEGLIDVQGRRNNRKGFLRRVFVETVIFASLSARWLF